MEIDVLWMNEYLMVVHEVEKARLARQGRRSEEPSPTGSPLSGPKTGTMRGPNGGVRIATARGGVSEGGGQWTRALKKTRVLLTGAVIALLGLLSHLAGQLLQAVLGLAASEIGIFYAIGARLVGLEMLALRIAALAVPGR